MYLENKYPHKRNTNVTVAGQMYRIGPGGFICSDEAGREPLDVPSEVAVLMLQGKAWRELSWDPSDPKNESLFMQSLADTSTATGGLGRPPRDMSMVDATQRPQPIPRAQIPPQAIGGGIDREGNLSGVEQSPPSDRYLTKSVESDQQAEAAYIEKARKRGTTEDEAQHQTMGDAAAGDGRQPDSTPQWKEPAEGKHWPDPDPKMPKEFLHKMADAYAVKYAKNIGTEKLIKRINDKMYEE